MARECYAWAPTALSERTVLLPAARGPRVAPPPEALWAPGVTRRPLPAATGGPLVRSRGLVLHVQAGDNSPWGWFAQPSTQASSHWWVAKSGLVEQYVPADRIAWAQVAGNSAWHSAETEGFPGEGLTADQVAALGRLYAWGHDRWGWSLELAESPDGVGLGWHGMGGAAWGGHFDCPGDLRKGQRQQIIEAAVGGGTENDMLSAEEIARAVWGMAPPTSDVDRPIRKRTMAGVVGEAYNKAGSIQKPALTDLTAKVDALAVAVGALLGADHPAAQALASPSVGRARIREMLAGLPVAEAAGVAADAAARVVEELAVDDKRS
jgi:hypothetical protein